MDSTAQLALDPQAHLPTGPTHVASRSARTAAQGAWTPTDRWAWACGLPVSGIARAAANCIARHANDKTGLGWPGNGTIATETGFCRRAVVKAIKELERGGTSRWADSRSAKRTPQIGINFRRWVVHHPH